MTKSEYVSACATIKQVSKAFYGVEHFILLAFGTIFLLCTGLFFMEKVFNSKNLLLIFSNVCLCSGILCVSLFFWTKTNKQFEERLNILNEYYKAGKSIDEFWDHESLKDCFPEKV